MNKLVAILTSALLAGCSSDPAEPATTADSGAASDTNVSDGTPTSDTMTTTDAPITSNVTLKVDGMTVEGAKIKPSRNSSGLYIINVGKLADLTSSVKYTLQLEGTTSTKMPAKSLADFPNMNVKFYEENQEAFTVWSPTMTMGFEIAFADVGDKLTISFKGKLTPLNRPERTVELTVKDVPIAPF